MYVCMYVNSYMYCMYITYTHTDTSVCIIVFLQSIKKRVDNVKYIFYLCMYGGQEFRERKKTRKKKTFS